MNIHKNARTTPYCRGEMVRHVLLLSKTPRALATALGVSEQTAAKWLVRHRRERMAGLVDRSSRPHRLPRATPKETVEQVIARKRCFPPHGLS